MELSILEPEQKQVIRAYAADLTDGELLFAVADILVEADPRLGALDVDTRLVAAAITGLDARGEQVHAETIAEVFRVDREAVRAAFEQLGVLAWQPPY